MEYARLAVSSLVVAVIVIGTLSLGIRTTLLRDLSKADLKPFSFSRVQLAWWTVLISVCLTLKFGFTGTLDVLTPGCLALLGISVVTAGSARIVDDRDIANAAKGLDTRIQDDPTESFFADILSDEQGPSVHRLQALIFNVVFGLGFVSEFVADVYALRLPDFTPTQLGLMGISSATYVAMKTGENK